MIHSGCPEFPSRLLLIVSFILFNLYQYLNGAGRTRKLEEYEVFQRIFRILKLELNLVVQMTVINSHLNRQNLKKEILQGRIVILSKRIDQI